LQIAAMSLSPGESNVMGMLMKCHVPVFFGGDTAKTF
jgi:hypothetical protein